MTELTSTQITESTPVRKTVSHSEVESFLRCERQHFYGYGLEIQRVAESDSLLRGTLGHDVLRFFFEKLKEGVHFKDAHQMTFEYLAEIAPTSPLLAAEVLECLTWFFKEYPFLGWKVLEVEKEYILPVSETLEMPLVVDLIIADPFGDIWVIDHKFVYDFVSDRDAELMPQIPKYVGALRALGYRIDKAGYSSLRYRQLKNPTGELKYRLTKINLNDHRVKQSIIEQLRASIRIQEIKSQPVEIQSRDALRTSNKLVCNSCSFRSLCVAELNNFQPQLILNTEYEKKQRREFKTIEQGE